ncbi:MAG: hypothetical protein AB7F89_13060, partial [Pirellulaceae bacterium]
MRKWIGVTRFLAVVLAVSCAWLPSLSKAQDPSTTVAPVESSDVDQVLRAGVDLEQQRRWAEALAHYEDAVRRYPHQPQLTERLVVARLHYEVARRYVDQSFLDAIVQLPPREAADLYGEVLLKIHAHHVDVPDWQQLFDRGTTAVEIALNEAIVQKRYGLR